MIAVPGRPFELADPRQLNAHHTVHAALLRAVADDDVQLYEHLVQHDAVPSMPAASRGGPAMLPS